MVDRLLKRPIEPIWICEDYLTERLVLVLSSAQTWPQLRVEDRMKVFGSCAIANRLSQSMGAHVVTADADHRQVFAGSADATARKLLKFLLTNP